MQKRRSGGFERLGRVGVEATGLPRRQARQLLLEHAWVRVAGEIIARRARAVGIERGVLEIDVSEPLWAKELVPYVPKIAGRLAREFPELGVKKLRVRVAGELARPACVPEGPDEAASET